MESKQVSTIQKLFNIMDESGEGILDVEELKKGFQTVNYFYEQKPEKLMQDDAEEMKIDKDVFKMKLRDLARISDQ